MLKQSSPDGGVPGLTNRGSSQSWPEHRYTVAEYDAACPCVIVGPVCRLTVELASGVEFTVRTADAWPATALPRRAGGQAAGRVGGRGLTLTLGRALRRGS
jgi:hypothetical protein